MKIQIYMVEVGVVLEPDNDEYEHYKYIEGFDYSLYDENLLYFTDKDKAIKYAKDYIDDGVIGTYGLVTDHGIPNLSEEQIKEIEESNSADDLWFKPTKEDIFFFDYKKL